MPLLFPDDLDDAFEPGLLTSEVGRLEGVVLAFLDRLSRILFRV